MISFIIPAKNEAGYIGECLRSIMAQASPEPLEIVVVDNNSSDNTTEIAKQVCPEASIVKEEMPGTSAARQKGFLAAKGDWLIFLDADVRLPDEFWLKRVWRLLDRQPKVAATSSHYRYYDLPWHLKILQMIGTFIFVYPWIFLTNNLLRHSAHMIGGMMVINRQALVRVGGFDVSTEFFGDETLISLKLYQQGRIIVSPSLWVWTSGRRFRKLGLLNSVFKYVINYFYVLWTGKAYQPSDYKELR